MRTTMNKSKDLLESRYKLFYSKYPFKNYPRRTINILYEGILKDIPKNVLATMKYTPTGGKYIIIYNLNLNHEQKVNH